MEISAVIHQDLPCGTNCSSIFENVMKVEHKYHSKLCVKEITTNTGLLWVEDGCIKNGHFDKLNICHCDNKIGNITLKIL